MIYPEKVRDLASLAPSTLEQIDRLWIFDGILDNDDLNVFRPAQRD